MLDGVLADRSEQGPGERSRRGSWWRRCWRKLNRDRLVLCSSISSRNDRGNLRITGWLRARKMRAFRARPETPENSKPPGFDGVTRPGSTAETGCRRGGAFRLLRTRSRREFF